MDKNKPLNAEAFSDIQQACDYLEKSVNYEKLPDVNYVRRNFNLERMRLFLDRMGSPQKRFKSVHVAGTKGKGSSANIIENCLRQCGVRTGLYTSPHLSSICERMKVNGEAPAEVEFCRLVGDVKPVIDELRSKGFKSKPTYFELTTGLSFKMFALSGVDWGIIEVGLGGRLDATNVLAPEVCLITPIGFDHMDKLGNTAGDIAGEKAGIIKPKVPTVLSRQDYPEAADVIRAKAKKMGAEVQQVGEDIQVHNMRAVEADGGKVPGWQFNVHGPGWSYDDLFIKLLGRHQVYNTASALGVVELLKQKGKLDCSPDKVRAALAGCQCPARVEVVQEDPFVILDTAHTPESMAALVEALRSHFPAYNIVMIFGCSQDKNYGAMLGMLSEISDEIILTRSASPRSVPTERLAKNAVKAGFSKIKEVGDTERAVREGLDTSSDQKLVCITGSFFLAGEVYPLFDVNK